MADFDDDFEGIENPCWPPVLVEATCTCREFLSAKYLKLLQLDFAAVGLELDPDDDYEDALVRFVQHCHAHPCHQSAISTRLQ